MIFSYGQGHGRLCAGTIALSEALVEALDALYTARIQGAEELNQMSQYLARFGPAPNLMSPKGDVSGDASTLRGCWQAGTLGAWWSGLPARHEQLARWLDGGRPKSFWMIGFFNPQARRPC